LEGKIIKQTKLTTKPAKCNEPKASRHCCLCRKSLSFERLIAESRPTGEFGNLEEWFYCFRCWFEMRKLQQEPIHRKKLFDAMSDK
jgi:hypothetical protein